MNFIVDKRDGEKDLESMLAEITMTDDSYGRVYIEFGKTTIGMDLQDLLKFIAAEMLK